MSKYKQPYTEDFKQEVIKYRETHTIKETMDFYKLSNHSVRAWTDPKAQEKAKNNQKKFYDKNKEDPKFLKKYQIRNKEKYHNNKEKYSKYNKQYYENNKEKVKQMNKSWAEINKEKDLERRKKYIKKKFETHPDWKIKSRLRTRMNLTLFDKGYIKADKTSNLLGCSPQELKSHLESLFQEGMTWDNYGKDGWHIDHIVPCSSFNLQDPTEQRKCFHYTNLQPLWAKDNLSKGSKVT